MPMGFRRSKNRLAKASLITQTLAALAAIALQDFASQADRNAQRREVAGARRHRVPIRGRVVLSARSLPPRSLSEDSPPLNTPSCEKLAARTPGIRWISSEQLAKQAVARARSRSPPRANRPARAADARRESRGPRAAGCRPSAPAGRRRPARARKAPIAGSPETGPSASGANEPMAPRLCSLRAAPASVLVTCQAGSTPNNSAAPAVAASDEGQHQRVEGESSCGKRGSDSASIRTSAP